jgi:hypothetical protein
MCFVLAIVQHTIFLAFRKNHKFVQEVVEIVNDSVELFDDVQRVFRELFTILGWPSICSFRFDFFMAMQSAGKIQVSAKTIMNKAYEIHYNR